MNGSRFTLVELALVVAITMVLAALAIPLVVEYQRDARRSEKTLNLEGIYTAEQGYHAATGSYTTDLSVLVYPDGAPYFIYGFCDGTGNYNTRVAIDNGVTAFRDDKMVVDGVALQTNDLPTGSDGSDTSFAVGAAGSADARTMEKWVRGNGSSVELEGAGNCGGGGGGCPGSDGTCYSSAAACVAACGGGFCAPPPAAPCGPLEYRCVC